MDALGLDYETTLWFAVGGGAAALLMAFSPAARRGGLARLAMILLALLGAAGTAAAYVEHGLGEHGEGMANAMGLVEFLGEHPEWDAAAGLAVLNGIVWLTTGGRRRA